MPSPLRHAFAVSIVVMALLGCSGTPNHVDCCSVAPIVPTAQAKFAYTGNEGGSVSGYAVNTSTGALTALSSFPVTVGENPTVVAHDPQNRFLLVGDIAASLLHVFAIDSATGALAEVSPSPYATVSEPVGIVVDPTGTHVYVAAMNANAIGAYSLSSSGVLSPVNGEPFATGGTQLFGDDLKLNATGTFLYTQDLANIYGFSVDSATGGLTLIQTTSGTRQGGALALDPAGSYLYAVGPGTNSILSYSIDAVTGLLTQSKTSPMLEQEGAYTMTVSPNGKTAYTIENNNDLVSYTVNDGVFTAVGETFSGVYGEKIAVDPSGSFVYVPQACGYCAPDVSNFVNEFTVLSTGALQPMAGSPVSAGITPWGMTITTQ